MTDNGYVRSVVVRFYKGPPMYDDTNYVKAVVQHQFIANSQLTLAKFKKHYNEILEYNEYNEILGRFSSTFEINIMFIGKQDIDINAK